MSFAVRLSESLQDYTSERWDCIHIDDLVYCGKHGVGDVERATAQPFKVSIKLAVDTRAAGLSDRITDTTDYKVIRNIVRRTIEDETFHLVEAIADRVASQILEDSRIRSVAVCVKKMAIWDNGIPGVTIVRDNLATQSPRRPPLVTSPPVLPSTG
jgi:dihydroneopterin aldolase